MVPLRPVSREVADSCTTQLPPNVVVPPFLQPHVEEALRSSPTLRAQCHNLARTPSVFVRFLAGGLRGDRLYAARAEIRKYEAGAMIANVVFYLPGNVVEVVAHELEHVLEQVEGLELRHLAEVRGSGVLRVGRDNYETDRAFDVGRRVSAEVKASRLQQRTAERQADSVAAHATVP
ncbi:MAG: hypothetical protein GEV06_01805 [Luteitalea sp.]|nr:hypothetical protein [Luteitalea sp.]